MAGTRILRALSVACVMIMVLTSFSMLVLAKKDDDSKVRVIVLFKDKVDKKLIEDNGGEILDTYEIIPGVVTELTQSEIKELKKSNKIKAVEADVEVSICKDANDEAQKGGANANPPKGETLPWGVDKIDAEKAWVASTGSLIKVAVMDTGIDKDHPDLIANIKGGVNFVRSGYRVDPNAWDDNNGHGTHCAGIIGAVHNNIGVVGVAYSVSLYAIKVLNSQGSGYYSDIIKGLDWAKTNQIKVVSMSFGGPADSSLEAACIAANAAGIVLVAAAGNSGGSIIYPAAYSSVIAVGATDSNNVRASWSSYGPELDLVAPGVSIYSTYKGGGYATMSGTSMACPHVSGVVALVLATDVTKDPQKKWDLNTNQKWDLNEVQNCLQTTADDLGTSGRDDYYGFGLVDAQEAATGVQS